MLSVSLIRFDESYYCLVMFRKRMLRATKVPGFVHQQGINKTGSFMNKNLMKTVSLENSYNETNEKLPYESLQRQDKGHPSYIRYSPMDIVRPRLRAS